MINNEQDFIHLAIAIHHLNETSFIDDVCRHAASSLSDYFASRFYDAVTEKNGQAEGWEKGSRRSLPANNQIYGIWNKKNRREAEMSCAPECV
jgi:hypothetical protein